MIDEPDGNNYGKVLDYFSCHIRSSTRGQFHKTLRIRKLQICSYGQILTLNLLINCKNSVIYGKIAINYEEKCFMEQAPGYIVGISCISDDVYSRFVYVELLCTGKGTSVDYIATFMD